MHSLSLALSLSPVGDNRSLVQSLFFDIVSLCFAFDLVKKKNHCTHCVYAIISQASRENDDIPKFALETCVMIRYIYRITLSSVCPE